ncbi:hypothetical protein ACSFB8_05000 [Enterococcus faecalis]
MDNAQVKRKHFRFPAYDDEIGVKIPSQSNRILFQDEFKNDKSAAPAAQTAPPQQKTSTNQRHTEQQKTQLARHKSNLPDYALHSKESSSAAKKNPSLFGSNSSNGWTQTFHKKETSRSAVAPKTQSSTSYSSSYFVPKYIPASIIPEEDATKPTFSEAELLQAMKKEPASYLVLDDEPAAFQVKQNETDPTVKKFNIPTNAPEIPVTRRQYQKLKPEMERFGGEPLPRSRTELKHAKKNAKSQTAYGQKVEAAKQEKKRGILDKPLSGIIEDSSSRLENSKYFN